MADDPNRDLLPVKEGSCIDTCRGSTIDPRDRHAVIKLDRYQLEDRYLRMLDELLELKKLSNSQEDKIKRLATKLMRASATPGSCLATTLDYDKDNNRRDNLELENAKLKDKITVLRSQILNHKMVGRSPSRSRRLQICPSSGPTTCRSDIGRIRSSTSNFMREINDRESENDVKSFLVKIEQLEMEKKKLSSRIEDLERQVASHEAGNQRQKVAENVEFIRVWRQMKLQSEELAASQARNVSLEEQIRDLKDLVEEKTRNNKDITTALLVEKKKMADMDEQLAKAKNSQLSLREKDEQIKDLVNEMKILHQHNAELIALSSKYGNVEMENLELRKKISEQLSDNLSLKSAFSNEQANISALQAANQQLMGKLHELQTHIDTLTIQLKSFQSQNERQEKPRSDRQVPRTVDRETSTNSLMEKNVQSSEEDFSSGREICKNCCQPSRETIAQQSGPIFVNCEVQTDPRDFETRRNSCSKVIEKAHCAVGSPMRDRSFQHDNGNLTPEEMIKLLEKAQINTPLDAQNISRSRRTESASTKNYVKPSDSRQSSFSATKISHQSLANDPWQILLVLYKILRENNANSAKILDEINSCVCDNDYRDENNNNSVKGSMDSRRKKYSTNMENIISENSKNANERRSDTRQKTDRSSRKNFSKESLKNSRKENLENRKTRTSHFVDQYTETSDCCCEDNEECTYEVDCGYPCVPSESAEEFTGHEERFDNCRCEMARDSFKNFVSDFSTSIQKTFDNIHKSRVSRVDGTPSGLYKSWERPGETRNSQNRLSKEINDSKFTVCRRAQCTLNFEKSDETVITKSAQYEVLRLGENFDNNNNKCVNGKSVANKSPYVSCCQKNCGDGPIVREIESFPMLITNDQGLLEIHIICLQLASMATGIFHKEKNINDLSLFVTWDIWNKEKAFTPSLKYPKFNFNSSSIHRITSLFEFFDRVIEQSVSFRIHISRGEKSSRAVARAFLSIKDIIDFPQTKLHYVANFSSILPCSRDKDFGQLSLWIRLSCDLEKLETFKKQRGIPRRHSSVDKKISKIENEGQQIYRPSGDLREKDKTTFSELDEIRVESLKILDREASLGSANDQIGKEHFQSSQIDNKNLSSSLLHPRISRPSKDSGSKRFTSEASSSTLERSLVNGKSINNASAADSYLTISRKDSIIKRSDSSIIRAMENEDTSSEDLRSEDKKRETWSLDDSLLDERKKSRRGTEKVETASVNEFNNLIHSVRDKNGTILSPRESRSSVQDLGSVFKDENWHKYKKKSRASEAKYLRTSSVPTEFDNRSKSSDIFADPSTSNGDAVIMRIESLTLFQRSSLLDNPEIHQLYVEFSFLGYRGVDLETISVPKPAANTRAYFNYMRKFEFDEEEHSAQRNIMRAMMTEDDHATINFILVSEPLKEEMETKECEEVGYAYFNIRDHILKGSSKDLSLTIMNVEQTEPIGILKITLLGADSIRRCMSDL